MADMTAASPTKSTVWSAALQKDKLHVLICGRVVLERLGETESS
jgi:hypothetical protein